jgi:hypothetical protein
MSRNINWIPIREDFVQRKMSQPELAKKYQVTETAVARKSIAEHWVNQREQFEVESQSKLREKGIDEIAKLNARKLEVGRWLMNLGIKSLRKYEAEGATIPDDKLSADILKKGFDLQSEALGVDNQITIDLKSFILNISVPEREVKDFIDWRNDRRKRELEEPTLEITGEVGDRVDNSKQTKD